MKRISAFFALGLISAAVFIGCSRENLSYDQGKVLNIACWNEEFKDRFDTYCKELIPSDVRVEWLILGDVNYQGQIDDILFNQLDKTRDEKLDMFLVEADFAQKYANSNYTLGIIEDVGLTEENLSRQYQYTKDIMTDKYGVLKGVSWQACPGGFFYRRSIAKNVFGTDDPKKIQNLLSDWDRFDKAAEKMSEYGYFMLSGFDDAYRVFWDNLKTPCVIDNVIQIDPLMQRWIDQTKMYSDLGYNNKANLWSKESFAGAKKNGRVFGYFGPAWFIDFCLAPATLDNPARFHELGNGSFGDWAYCNGPQGFSWGGTWICAASGSDNVSLVHDIMYKLTCEEVTAVRIATEKNDFSNNERAMMKIASSSYTSPFLGGQNHLAGFVKNAKRITKKNMTVYDRAYSEEIQSAFSQYFSGEISQKEAVERFYDRMESLFPELRHND